MRQQLSAQELVTKLNEGGWQIWGGHELKHGMQRQPVLNAYQADGKTWIAVAGYTFELKTDDVRIHDPWWIDIYQSYVTRCQRKQADGGGWHEVLVPHLGLRMMNPEMRKEITKDRVEQARQREQERKQREAEAREAARQRFVAKLTNDFVSKKLASINVLGEDLYLEFDDGSKLFVELDGGDLYDAWINVNQTPLRDFKHDLLEEEQD